MKCSSCGTDNPDGAQFCSNCGASLGAYTTGGDWAGNDQPQKISFTNAISLGFNRYLKFSGRSTRAEYWWFRLFVLIGSVAFSIIGTSAGLPGVLEVVWWIATLMPSLAVGVRRLHDINRTGWWLLLMFAILIGEIVLLLWAVKRSDDGTNSYGPKPWTANLNQL
jgi:uncharacterized membrane protein YhaH (DUF805 family)